MINAKFNIWSIFLLLTSVFVFTVPSAVAQRLNIGLPFIRHFSADDYQGGIQNWSITQDKRGFLYVANNFGMLEYDGAIWKRFQVINGSKVRDILVADNGYIYLASQGDFGYFSPDRFGSLVYTSLADSL
ncbi:MAG: histidine kinase, partial [Bacteroidota bacterium]